MSYIKIIFNFDNFCKKKLINTLIRDPASTNKPKIFFFQLASMVDSNCLEFLHKLINSFTLSIKVSEIPQD